MIACAASAGFGWKNGNCCRNACDVCIRPGAAGIRPGKIAVQLAGVKILSLGEVRSCEKPAGSAIR